MVAAWMRAEAGVGPSIASGSQSWNGTRPDLPATPMTTPTSPTVSAVSCPLAVSTAMRSVLLARAASVGTLAVVADEQPRAPAHDLPADEDEDEVRRLDEQEHAGREQRDGGCELAVARV